MTKLIDIFKFLNINYPHEDSQIWDYSSFLNIYSDIDYNKTINKILITLDFNNECFLEIIKEKPDLIITRHPYLFFDVTNLDQIDNNKRKIIKYILENDIYVYSIHTNYDSNSNDYLFKLIDKKFNIINFSNYSNSDSECKKITLQNKVNIKNIINNLSLIFNSNDILCSNNINKSDLIKEFYIVTGSGFSTAITNNMSNICFVTGEVKWNEWIYANDNNIKLISLGHYMENYFIDDIENKIKSVFLNIKIKKIDIKNQYNRKKDFKYE